ncbi:MAG: DUF1684 domain-containing protein [Flavobacteriaceae bacterium]|nr:DUF1684 domain-containing protein [Flavobacteriaceae bacterium]
MKQTIFVLGCLLFGVLGFAQDKDAIQEIENFVSEQNVKFKDLEESTLPPKYRKKIKQLEYFPIDLKYRLEAKFVRADNELALAMETSTSRRSIYMKYNELNFEIDGKKLQLSMCQNQNLILEEEYKDYLFLPFTDQISGETSYGGGRYIDMRIPESDTVILDFNQSYNPYCAYGGAYSCPIPPAENFLDVKIDAGVKDYHKH